MTAVEKLNILLVDDQPSKLLSYEVILQDLGENLLKASSGTEALSQLLQNEIAVVLVDVCMPDLDGFELAAMIREHPRYQKTAIIFISAINISDVDRLRGYEMGAVDYVPVPVVPAVLRAKVKIFAELYRKTRQLEALNRELEIRVSERTAELESYVHKLAESEQRRNLALAAGAMGSWDWDLINGDWMWDEGQCRIFGVDPQTFKPTLERVMSLVEPQDAERLQEMISDFSDGAKAYQTEFRVRRPDGERRWCFGTAAPSADEAGRLVRVSGVTIDITDRKEAEERQAFLAKEVDHRARNVLAIVQSMLRLTKAESAEAYAAVVEGRIRALSRAHMLLSESRWEGADLKRMLVEELDPYRAGDRVTINDDGPAVLLDAKRAQTVALGVHELATNAAKYGALSNAAGKLSVSWGIGANGLTIEWLEQGGPEVVPPKLKGYGTRVIKASLEQLGGRADFNWRRDGLLCQLLLPLGEMAEHRNRGGGQKLSNMPAKSSLEIDKGSAVMLVEDESIVAMMMAEALTTLGFKVVGPCTNLGDAMSAAARQPIAAAILDIRLGEELVYPLADDLAARGIPFVFVSGYGLESLNPRYRTTPVLQKPVDVEALRNLFAVPAGETAAWRTASRY
jgi:PAS domain S-box-containing protein